MEEQIQEQEKKQNVNTGLVALDIVSKMNNVNIDMQAIVREYGIATVDVEPEEIVRIAQNNGFKVKKKNLKVKDLSKNYPYPAILQKKDNSYIILLALKT